MKLHLLLNDFNFSSIEWIFISSTLMDPIYVRIIFMCSRKLNIGKLCYKYYVVVYGLGRGLRLVGVILWD